MTWTVHIDLAGTLTDEQAAHIIEHDPVQHVHTTPDTATVTTRLTVADDTIAPVRAATAAADTLRAMGYLNSLVSAGVITVDRITVESPQDRARRLPLLGTAEIAATLGVTPARVGQLKTRPDWPRPAVQVEGGDLYWAADIHQFNDRWDRSPGRPRKSTTGG